MLCRIAEKLDQWVVRKNLEAEREGFLHLKPCRIRLLGQMALLELQAPLALSATNDVDVYADYEYAIEQEFRRLLALNGKELDSLGSAVWMPEETRYTSMYAGQFVTLEVADLESVLISKGLKAPAKNGAIITEYLASGASAQFMVLAAKYSLNLEQFL
jgi:hypothetical protein